MIKLVYILALLMSVFYSSCRQNQTDVPEAYIKSEFKDTVTSYGPSRMVRNVKQAKNGDILIAAYNGVFRYDGKLFTNITSRIPSPSFWDVEEDRKGNLWFATRDSGFYLLPSGQTTFKHFTTKQGLASNYASLHLFEDKAGNIWFSSGNGASRYDGKTLQHFTTKDGLPKNGINAFMEDRTGKLWIGTREELCYYDGKTFTILKNKDGKTFNNVWGILEDRKGNIWFGGWLVKDGKESISLLYGDLGRKDGGPNILDAGLWRYDGDSIIKASQKGAYAILEDKNGNLWTTGGDDSPTHPHVWTLSRYDQKSLYDPKPKVTEIKSGPAFLGLLEAKDGSIWFGSMNGVYRYDGKTITDFKREEDQK